MRNTVILAMLIVMSAAGTANAEPQKQQAQRMIAPRPVDSSVTNSRPMDTSDASQAAGGAGNRFVGVMYRSAPVSVPPQAQNNGTKKPVTDPFADNL